jgi:hypothetical protein
MWMGMMGMGMGMVTGTGMGMGTDGDGERDRKREGERTCNETGTGRSFRPIFLLFMFEILYVSCKRHVGVYVAIERYLRDVK